MSSPSLPPPPLFLPLLLPCSHWAVNPWPAALAHYWDMMGSAVTPSRQTGSLLLSLSFSSSSPLLSFPPLSSVVLIPSFPPPPTGKPQDRLPVPLATLGRHQSAAEPLTHRASADPPARRRQQGSARPNTVVRQSYSATRRWIERERERERER